MNIIYRSNIVIRDDKILLTSLWLLHGLANSAWASYIWAERAEQLGKINVLQKKGQQNIASDHHGHPVLHFLFSNSTQIERTLRPTWIDCELFDSESGTESEGGRMFSPRVRMGTFTSTLIVCLTYVLVIEAVLSSCRGFVTSSVAELSLMGSSNIAF